MPLLPCCQSRLTIAGRWAEGTDRRLRFMASVLRHIKAIKLSAYEAYVTFKAEELRHMEVTACGRWVHHVRCDKLAWHLFRPPHHHHLYSRLILLESRDKRGYDCENFHRHLDDQPHFRTAPGCRTAYPRLLTTWASFKRIEEFLLCAERSIPDVYDESEGDATCENPEEALNTPDRRIALRDASFGIKGKATLLSGPNIDLTAPDLWMVIGRVGSVHFLCVTYLRNALISNHCRARVPSSILSLESSISLPVPVRCDSGRSAIAHSIHGFRANNTIRDNVTFMHPFEAVWYRTVVSAGALEQI